MKLNIKNKYHNNKVIIDNITFASKKEAKRYNELKLLEKANLIKDLQLQTRFNLQPSFKFKSKIIRAIDYIADFTYYDVNGNYVVEDVKGSKFMMTDIYKLKKKLFEYKYKIEITEII